MNIYRGFSELFLIELTPENNAHGTHNNTLYVDIQYAQSALLYHIVNSHHARPIQIAVDLDIT